MKFPSISLLLIGLVFQSVVTGQPASANHYKHVRNERRKAAHQEAKAQIDMAEGKFKAANKHERKAMKDRAKAHLY